jgi:hypothetical protein
MKKVAELFGGFTFIYLQKSNEKFGGVEILVYLCNQKKLKQ